MNSEPSWETSGLADDADDDPVCTCIIADFEFWCWKNDTFHVNGILISTFSYYMIRLP